MDADHIAKAVVAGAKDYIDRAIAPLVEELKAQKQRIAELEERGIRFRGAWRAAEDYRRGDLVTHDGSLWHANLDARAVRPGDGNIWTLAVKRGRDGKNAR